jgi:hypothetical protein
MVEETPKKIEIEKNSKKNLFFCIISGGSQWPCPFKNRIITGRFEARGARFRMGTPAGSTGTHSHRGGGSAPGIPFFLNSC